MWWRGFSLEDGDKTGSGTNTETCEESSDEDLGISVGSRGLGLVREQKL